MKFRALVMIEVLMVMALFGFNSASVAAEWESTLAAAKKEGKVSVITDVTATLRDALTLEFQKNYGISVELFGSSGREVAPRIAAERKAGQFLWDIYIHGSTTALEAMIPMGAFDPLEPALILQDIKDPKTWRGGAIEFLDPGKMVIVMTPFQRGTIFYNPKLVNAKEFKSHKDLLNPKWKGKMVVDDPRRAGPGVATFTFFYLHPELGPEFIRALGKQQMTILKGLCAGGGCGRSRPVSGAYRCSGLCRDQQGKTGGADRDRGRQATQRGNRSKSDQRQPRVV